MEILHKLCLVGSCGGLGRDNRAMHRGRARITRARFVVFAVLRALQDSLQYQLTPVIPLIVPGQMV